MFSLALFRALPKKPLTRTNTATSTRHCISWGSSYDGKLGSGTCSDGRFYILPNVDVVALSCGRHHSLALARDGVLGWGSNFYGQAGYTPTDKSVSTAFFTSEDEDLDAVEVPALLDLANIKQLVAGDFHSLALDKSGNLFAWGAACLGTGNELYDSKPVHIDFFERRDRAVAVVKAAGAMSLAVAFPNSLHENSLLDSCSSVLPVLSNPEVYLWGYFMNEHCQIQKSKLPLLCSYALNFDYILDVAASRDVFAICGKFNGVMVLSVFGSFLPHSEVLYPTYLELRDTELVYNLPPKFQIPLHFESFKQFVIFGNMAFFVLETGVIHVVNILQSVQSLLRVNCSKPATHLSIGEFGLIIIFKDGQVRFWKFDKPWEKNILDVLKQPGEVVVETGGIVSAVGWDHALVHYNFEE